MLRLLALGAVAVLLASTHLPAAHAADPRAEWPQFRGPNRDNHSPDKGLLQEWPADGPPVSWKATGLGGGYSTVSVGGGRIFTMGDKDDASCVFALDAKDGKQLWEAKVGKSGAYGGYEGPRGTPTVDGDRIYALNQHGELVCMAADSGKEIWRKDFKKDFKGRAGGWGYSESVLVDGDRVICTPGGKDATIVALDKKSGEPVWKASVLNGSAAGYSSVVIATVDGARQYVQLLAQGVAAVSAADGKALWTYGDRADRFAGNTANIPTPIVDGNAIFCVAGYGRGGGLVELKATSGGFEAKEAYFSAGLNNKHGGVVRVGDHIYGDRDSSGNPYCAEWKTGKVSAGWQKRGSSKGNGSVAITFADGHLYLRYQNGIVALVEPTPEKYKEKASFKIANVRGPSWPHPVVIGGRLYLREQDTLWCHDVTQR